MCGQHGTVIAAPISRWNRLDNDDELRLSYCIHKYTQDISADNVRATVRAVFDKWSTQIASRLTNVRPVHVMFDTQDVCSPTTDIVISWETGVYARVMCAHCVGACR